MQGESFLIIVQKGFKTASKATENHVDKRKPIR